MNNTEKEIKAAEQMIQDLYRCLAIHKESSNYEELNKCLLEIQFCRRKLYELKREKGAYYVHE